MTNSDLKNAYNILKRDLRSCYAKEGIFAGLRHFDDYWARDGFFAGLGALELEDYNIVRKQLNLFSKFQKKDGELPLRVGSYNILSKFMGFKRKRELKPRYEQDKLGSHAVDPNSLFVNLGYEYYQKTRDISFLRKKVWSFKKSVDWLLSVSENLLISEKKYGNWADSLKKEGKVFYSNVCFVRSLYCISNILKTVGENKLAREYKQLYIEAKNNLEIFWTETDTNTGYYIDWISDKKRSYFSTDGNVLAIVWNLTKKKKQILNFMEKNSLNKGFCVKTNFPSYESQFIYPPLKYLGMKDYHNGQKWLWLGFLDVVAKYENGKKKKSKRELQKILQIVLKYDNVYEVYEEDGKPVNRLFYKSEVPFAWSSGIGIYALSKIK